MSKHLPERASRDASTGSGDSAEIEDAGPDHEFRGRHHTVRPVWAWSGLALLIAGSIVAGVGFILLSVPWIVAGGVVIAAGAGAAVYGGLLYDIEGTGVSIDDDRRQVPGSMARADDPELTREIAAEEHHLADVRSRQGVRPSMRKPAAGVLLVVAAYLLATQGAYYDQTPVGRDGTLRASGFAILLALAGLYLFLVRSGAVAAGICALVGVGLVLTGLLADHGRTAAAVNETVCGVIVLVAVLVVLAPLLRGRSGRLSARSGA